MTGRILVGTRIAVNPRWDSALDRFLPKRGKRIATWEYDATVRKAFRSEWETPLSDFGFTSRNITLTRKCGIQLAGVPLVCAMRRNLDSRAHPTIVRELTSNGKRPQKRRLG